MKPKLTSKKQTTKKPNNINKQIDLLISSIDSIFEFIDFTYHNEDLKDIDLSKLTKEFDNNYNEELIKKLKPILINLCNKYKIKLKNIDISINNDKISIIIEYGNKVKNLSYNINTHLYKFIDTLTNVALKYKIDNLSLADNIKEIINMCDIISKNDGWMKNKDLAKLVMLSNNIKQLQIYEKS